MRRARESVADTRGFRARPSTSGAPRQHGGIPLKLATCTTGVGRTLDGAPVLLLINGYDIRIIHATTGEIIRSLVINPPTPLPRHRQPADPKDPEKSNGPDHDAGPDRFRCLATSHGGGAGFEPATFGL